MRLFFKGNTSPFPMVIILLHREATKAETTKVNNNKRSEIKALYCFIGIRFWVTNKKDI